MSLIKCQRLILFFPLIFLMAYLPTSSTKYSTSSSSSTLKYGRGGTAFHGGEVRQNAAAGAGTKQRYAHLRRTWLRARERTAHGRRLERLLRYQADSSKDDAESESSGDSLPPMFMVDAKPIKNSIDELQSVIQKQSSQGYKDMLRALMVMYRQMSKWHQNVTSELHKLVVTSENTENGLTNVNADVKALMREMKKMSEFREKSSPSAGTLDTGWDDYDPRNFDDYTGEESIFEDFVDKETKVSTITSDGDFIESPVTETKKNYVHAYEWMPDKDHAHLHSEDKKSARVKVVSSTHINNNDNKRGRHHNGHQYHRGGGGVKERRLKPTPKKKIEKEKAERLNEVVIDEEEMKEIRKAIKAKAESKEFDRKKEARKKVNEKMTVGQVQGDVLTMEHLESRIATGDISKLSETHKKRLMKPYGDCSELLWRWKQEDVTPKDGIYAIRPRGCATFLVYCEFENARFGWTVIQRREDGSVDFDRDWEDYKKGFGQLDGELWLGNYGIDCVANQGGAYTLHIDVEKWDETHYWAEYNDFRIEDEAWNYILRVQQYNESSTAGDSLLYQGDHHGNQRYYHNQIGFSTKDNDNDRFDQGNCAAVATGGWWFNACHYSNLNGKYYSYKGEDSMEHADGLTWLSLTNNWYSLKASTMKIRANYLSGL